MKRAAEQKIKTIAEALKEYRISHDLTLEKIAALTGVSVSGFQKMETGVHAPNDRSLRRLCANLPGLTAMIGKGEHQQENTNAKSQKQRKKPV